ncbi:uncharacterized protein LOC108734725 isoform X2 [Agrilus planipennis]|uniref:Telomerase reverse transcriptase n=1 Tax=Agrilus planipennis TaxID=224129 RepID=A0A7F5R7N7_AGRPL|nr:uncharacterized protein LOC108734725 isoform X2 [Agrilus planipennis]
MITMTYFRRTQRTQTTINEYFSLEPINENRKRKMRGLSLKQQFGSEECTEKYKILQDILKKNKYFGSKSNRKIFYCTVKKIIRRSRFECIYRRELYQGYDYTCMTWLTREQDFVVVNEWVLNRIVKPIINKYFFAMKDINTNYGLKLIPMRKWFSFQTRVIQNMIKNQHLQPLSCNPTCIRGKLSILMKKDINNVESYRPIVLLNKNSRGSESRKKLKEIAASIRKLASEMCDTKTKYFYQEWSKFVEETGYKNIYGAVADVKDAFGSITTKKMSNLLDKLVEEKNMESAKGYYIKAHIRNQNVIYQFTRKGIPHIGRWKHGLLQGDILSSALCQLYISDLDRQYLTGFSQNFLLHRSTDDYFFCTTNREDLTKFMAIMKKHYKINVNKFQSSIINDNILLYNGNIFIMGSKEIKCHYKFKKGSLMKHKCKFWNLRNQVAYERLDLFIKRTLEFPCNNYFFSKMYINTVFNSYATVLDNFFEGMVYIALKFDAAVVAAYRENIPSGLLIEVIKTVFNRYCKKCIGILNKNAKNDENTRINSKSHFYKLSILAFQLVLKKRKWLYGDTIKQLNVMNKSHVVLQKCYINMQRFRKIPDVFKYLKIGTCIRYKKICNKKC